MNSKRGLNGFTLLELSVVIFLMTVLLGFAIPRFSNFMESTLEKETRKIAYVLDELRMEAIMKGESYRLEFDTMDSELSIYTASAEDPTEYTPHEKYDKPIKLQPPVKISKITLGEEDPFQSRFGFEKLEFDKIFGQEYYFKIDSSGFIDLFTLKLKDNENTITLAVTTIMGDLSIGQETPL